MVPAMIYSTDPLLKCIWILSSFPLLYITLHQVLWFLVSAWKETKVLGRRWRKAPILPFVSKRSSPSATYQREGIHLKTLLHA